MRLAFYFYKVLTMKIVSKWNGRNYYGYETKKSNPIEVVKSGGRFYRTKFVIGEWLRAVWNPIKDFTLKE